MAVRSTPGRPLPTVACGAAIQTIAATRVSAASPAIAAAHASARTAHETPWGEIVGLYDLLLDAWPSPVVALNRAVAVSFADGPLAGLEAIDELSTDPQLSTYPYLAAARGDCLDRLERFDEARQAFEEAALLTENTVERDFMHSRATYLG